MERITSAKFITSVADGKNLYAHNMPEIAVAGKSNVGKSSFINFICNNKKLARTSSEPGRTRLLNYFEINNGQLMLVDLPGYGFARVSKTEQQKWGDMVEGYFANSPALKHVFVLLDIRHEPTADDKQLIHFLYANNFNFTLIATKSDKLSKEAARKALTIITQSIGVGTADIIAVSALNKIGADKVYARITQVLGI